MEGDRKNYLISLIILILVTTFVNLGERPLFGVEGRWAEGAREMSLRNSWFVPTINFEPHVTKPLIPFWLIKISGEIFGYNEFAVRLPGAILALASVYLFFLLSKKIFEDRLALIATGLYVTSVGFIQFSRLAQSEIFQLFGIVAATTVYFYYRDRTSIWGYLLFTLSLLFGALSKGLTAIAVLLSFVFIDIILNRRFYHLNLKTLVCIITGLFLYFLPYYLTSKELGTDLPFHLWVRENLKQVTDPYDNIRPFYIYLYFWPLWIAPFSIFLIGALVYAIRNYRTLKKEGKLFFLVNLVILVIFTMAKARRGYYILPIIPFSILLIVFYIMKVPQNLPKRIYQKFFLISPLLTLAIPLFLLLFGLKIRGEIILPIVLFGAFQILILIKHLKGFDFYFSMILISLSLQALFFGFIQPNYSFSTEKEAGLFLKKLTSDQSEKAICTLQKEFQPVANFYFYAEIREKLPEINPTEKALEKCQIVVLRKNLPPELERKAINVGYQIKSFESKGDKSKTYFIIYNSSTLKTPSL